MTLQVQRACAALLGASAALVGVWAGFFPQSFHDDFPLPGRGWASAMGPYNEHLVRDVGTLYLALWVVSAWAAWRPDRERFVVTGLAWLVFSVPHLLFHLQHLAHFPLIDVVGQITTLGGTCLLAASLLLPARGSVARADP